MRFLVLQFLKYKTYLSDINIGAATILGFHILFLFCNFLEVALTATYFVELHTLHLHPVHQKSDSLSRRI
jgi:hypothetical protein